MRWLGAHRCPAHKLPKKGGVWPSRLQAHGLPLDNGSKTVRCLMGCVVRCASSPLCCMLFLSVNLSVLCYVGSCSHEPAKSWAEVLLWGSRFMLVKVFFLAWVGRFPGRGELGFARCPGPHYVTPEIRGGPWAPPPRIHRQHSPSQTVLLSVLGSVWLRFFYWIFGCSGRTNLMYGGFALQVLVFVGFLSVPPLFLHPPLSSSLGLLDTFVMQKQRLQTPQSYTCTFLGSGHTGAHHAQRWTVCLVFSSTWATLSCLTLLCDDSLLRRDFGLFGEAIWEGIP